jgi:hypothetical protein
MLTNEQQIQIRETVFYAGTVPLPSLPTLLFHLLLPFAHRKPINLISFLISGLETSIWLPNPPHDVVSFRFHPSGNRHGAYDLPDFFYEGAVFSLTTKNSFDLEVNCPVYFI